MHFYENWNKDLWKIWWTKKIQNCNFFFNLGVLDCFSENDNLLKMYDLTSFSVLDMKVTERVYISIEI